MCVCMYNSNYLSTCVSVYPVYAGICTSIYTHVSINK